MSDRCKYYAIMPGTQTSHTHTHTHTHKSNSHVCMVIVDTGACVAIATYYRNGTSAPWLRIPPVKPGTTRAGGDVDDMVDKDMFSGFPSPACGVKIPRNADGGLEWTWYGPDNDDEFMNVLNRHAYFGELMDAWRSTGNPVYVASAPFVNFICFRMKLMCV